MNNLQLKLIITLCLTLLFNFAHAKGEDKSLTLHSPSKEVRIDISWKNQSNYPIRSLFLWLPDNQKLLFSDLLRHIFR